MIVSQAALIQQISAKSDNRDVRHTEKICTGGVIRVVFFLAINRADNRHS